MSYSDIKYRKYKSKFLRNETCDVAISIHTILLTCVAVYEMGWSDLSQDHSLGINGNVFVG